MTGLGTWTPLPLGPETLAMDVPPASGLAGVSASKEIPTLFLWLGRRREPHEIVLQPRASHSDG